jgi:hypothetical protein
MHRAGWIARSLLALAFVMCGGWVAIAPAQPPADSAPDAASPEAVEAAIDRGLAFMLATQNKDGSWGGAQNAVYTFTGDVWSNPETHRAWKVATTGLGVMTLLQVGDTEEGRAALSRGIDYLCKEAPTIRRPNEWDTMNSWAYIFGLQALAEAYEKAGPDDSEARAKIRNAAEACARNLGRFQSLHGGWGYLEFNVPRTRQPQWGTSFTTASAVVALQEGRRQGFTIDEAVLNRAIRAVEHCKLPNGAYTYHIRPIPNLHSEYIDQVKGSLCRIQVANAALRHSGKDVPLDELRWGLDQFFEHHRFLEIALNKPIPHENFYYNSGYFYLYGHYYAAMIIRDLPEEDQQKYWPKLRDEVMKIQQADGSMWDYDMHSYHKPYGTSFGLMTLGRSLAKVERP